MQYSTLSGRLEWSWVKTSPDIRALLFRYYPRFVFRDVDEIDDEVPIFTFHSVDPDIFESYCQLVHDGGYRAIDLDEYLWIRAAGRRPPKKAIVLTFDDGLASTWTVAFPLLRRYGLRATTFVIPGLVPDGRPRPTLDDPVGPGPLETPDQECRQPLCNWAELRRMQESGVISVESHTLHHARVHCGARLRDFVNPKSDVEPYGNIGLPVVRENGRDRFDRPFVLGRPIYEMNTMMAGHPRYFDDEDLRRACENYVQANGGAAFFSVRGWRRDLHELVRRSSVGGKGGFQSLESYRRDIEEDLAASKSLIEANLGNTVRHLCYPWYRGSQLSIEASRRVGFTSNLWGPLPSLRAPLRDRDPFLLPRLDERYIVRLPGPGRAPLSSILREQYLRNRIRALP